MPWLSSQITLALMPLPYSEVAYVAGFFPRVSLPQRSSTTTSFATGDSLKSQASSSSLLHAVSDSSHSPSENITDGLYRVTRSLNWGIMCSDTYRFLSLSH